MKALSLLTILIIGLNIISCGQHREPSKRIEVAANGIHGGTLSSDGKLAIIGSVHHGGSLWRLKDGERLYNWNHSKAEPSVIISAAIDPKKHWAITAEAHTLVLWQLNSGDPARFWTAPGEVLDIDLAPGGRYALLGQADHSAVIFNTIRGGIVRSFNHEGRVRSVDLSADGKFAITGSEDQTAAIWEVSSGKRLMTIKHQEDVQQVALSRDGRYAFTAAKYDQAKIWSVKKKTAIKTLPLAKERIKRGLEITAARFSDNNRYLLLGYTNRTVELWQLKGMKKLKSWKLTKRRRWQPTSVSAIDLAFAPGNKRYYAMGSSGFIYWLK